jgi:hypothetical protein
VSSQWKKCNSDLARSFHSFSGNALAELWILQHTLERNGKSMHDRCGVFLLTEELLILLWVHKSLLSVESFLERKKCEMQVMYGIALGSGLSFYRVSDFCIAGH